MIDEGLLVKEEYNLTCCLVKVYEKKSDIGFYLPFLLVFFILVL